MEDNFTRCWEQAESLIDMNRRVGSGLLKSMESGSENLANSLEDLI
jgi:hypothetical protein